MTNKNTGARWEITVDGTPRTYRDDEAIAIDVTVRDIETTVI
jgi:hypothetical protein